METDSSSSDSEDVASSVSSRGLAILGLVRGSCNVGGPLFLSGGTDRSESEGFDGGGIVGGSGSERFPSQSFQDRLVRLRVRETVLGVSSGVRKLRLAEPLEEEPEDWPWSLTELSWGVEVMEEGVRGEGAGCEAKARGSLGGFLDGG